MKLRELCVKHHCLIFSAANTVSMFRFVSENCNRLTILGRIHGNIRFWRVKLSLERPVPATPHSLHVSRILLLLVFDIVCKPPKKLTWSSIRFFLVQSPASINLARSSKRTWQRLWCAASRMQAFLFPQKCL
jgi:hypothetical protein